MATPILSVEWQGESQAGNSDRESFRASVPLRNVDTFPQAMVAL